MQTIKCVVVGDGAVGKVREGYTRKYTCERDERIVSITHGSGNQSVSSVLARKS